VNDEAPDIGTNELPRPPVVDPRALRRVHHLNCATLCPVGGALVNAHRHLVCHCLLVETTAGLVLVDTGLGLDLVADPPAHTSAFFRRAFRPRLQPEETAIRQIERLGFSAEDVRHVVLTHLDLDHAGGLRDFPAAEVHLLADEHAAARAPRSLIERERYRHSAFAHDVKWQLHAVRGERWYGFECVRDIPGLPQELLLVPLIGHSRGHAGVAIDVGGRWILHCGDAYFYKDEVHPTAARSTPVLGALQRIIAADEPMRRHNQERLRELARGVGDGISLFSAHDPDDWERMRSEAGAAASASGDTAAA
jgi:glyoxylase-like metal-dependent hydrolase (beta-lactamase superfamily II)